MSKDTQIARALGYYARAHAKAESLTDAACPEFENDIDCQIAFRHGWTQAVNDAKEGGAMAKDIAAINDRLNNLTMAIEAIGMVIRRGMGSADGGAPFPGGAPYDYFKGAFQQPYESLNPDGDRRRAYGGGGGGGAYVCSVDVAGGGPGGGGGGTGGCTHGGHSGGASDVYAEKTLAVMHAATLKTLNLASDKDLVAILNGEL